MKRTPSQIHKSSTAPTAEQVNIRQPIADRALKHRNRRLGFLLGLLMTMEVAEARANGDNSKDSYGALAHNTSGVDNTAYGTKSLYSNTVGSQNTANGGHALFANIAGFGNTANGWQALADNTNGWHNSANGAYALRDNTSGYDNTANGYEALYNNVTGVANTANGVYALYANITGGANTANGYGALGNNTTAYDNTANGYGALYENITGNDNTATGAYALHTNTTGHANTADGFEALRETTTGTNNVALGYAAGYNITTGDNNIDIGNPGVPGDDNIIRIGTSQTAVYITGTLYNSSDRNAKENFERVDAGEVLDKVASMPVSRWNYKRDSASEHIGPMAQDFYAAFKVGADDKHIATVDEGGVALAAIQGLNRKLEAQMAAKNEEIENLKAKAARVDSLEKRLNELTRMVQALVANK